MPWRTRQAVSPPDGCRIKHDIVLRAVVDRGRIGTILYAIIFKRRALCDNLHAGQIQQRLAMKLPANESFDGVARLHTGGGVQPMFGSSAGPIARALTQAPHTLPYWVSCAQQQSTIGPHIRLESLFVQHRRWKLLAVCDGQEPSLPADGTIGSSVSGM